MVFVLILLRSGKENKFRRVDANDVNTKKMCRQVLRYTHFVIEKILSCLFVAELLICTLGPEIIITYSCHVRDKHIILLCRWTRVRPPYRYGGPRSVWLIDHD